MHLTFTAMRITNLKQQLVCVWRIKCDICQDCDRRYSLYLRYTHTRSRAWNMWIRYEYTWWQIHDCTPPLVLLLYTGYTARLSLPPLSRSVSGSLHSVCFCVNLAMFWTVSSCLFLFPYWHPPTRHEVTTWPLLAERKE